MSGTRELVFTREKETRNTIRFQEEPPEGQPPVVGYLYLQRWFANGAQKVRVTIHAE